MSLDGLRAWIGEVERKLGMRTRVFLALATIAIGVGGAGVYLALDARSDSVSESDVRELQEELEAQIGTGGTTGAADFATLEAELDALRAEVEKLRSQDGATDQGKGATGATGASNPESGTGATGTADTTDTGTGVDTSTDEAALGREKLREQIKEQSGAAK
jgi:glutamate dehydrogenase/leucine dehydrogenase